MRLTILMLVWIFLTHGTTLEEQYMKLSRQRRWLTIPSGSAIGLIIAFAVPIDLPTKQNVLLSYNFEANYNLPDDPKYFGPVPFTDLNTDPIVPPATRALRSITRKSAYQAFQHRIESFGFNGQACLLRMICEMSQMDLYHNGLVGELLHVLLMPSSSAIEDLPSEFKEAEAKGANNANCQEIYCDCPENLIDLFTTKH